MIFDNLRNRGTLYGDGIFETMRVGPNGVWELDAHVERLKKTADYFGLNDICIEAVETLKSLITDEICLVRVTLIRQGDASPLPGQEGGVFWNKRALPNILEPNLVGIDGLYIPDFELHEFKTTSYLRSIHCKNTALALGYDDGLMLSKNGNVGEASTSNIWAVFDSYVATPNISGILPGIVRAKILRTGLGGLPIQERPIKINELLKAREITMSSVGVGVIAAKSFHYQGHDLTLQNSWSKIVAAELFDGW